MLKSICGVVGVLAWLSLVGTAEADVLLLEDGRIIERPGMEVVEGGVKVPFENGEILVPDELIEDRVLENQPAPEPKSQKEREKRAKGLVPYQGLWMKPGKRKQLIQKHIAARKREIAEIREHQKWGQRYKEETKHFKFEHTLPPHVFAYFRDLMEAYYKEFAKTWKIKQTKEYGKLLVCFYTDLKSFERTGGMGNGVQGWFKFVPPLELNFYYARLDPYHTEQVMYHEANHYLQLMMNPKFDMPHFVGESLAEYYGASVFDPKAKKLKTGNVLESRLAEIKTDVAAGNMMPLEKMLTSERMYQHYTWGWSLAHFLMNDKRYRKGFLKFIKDLPNGKGVKRTRSGAAGMLTVSAEEMYAHFRRCLKLKNSEQIATLETEWHAYVKDGLKFVTARGLEKAASAAKRSGRPIRAKRLFKEAIDAGSKNPLTYRDFADMLRWGESSSEAIQYYRKAVKLGPLEPTFYADLGKALFYEGLRKNDDAMREEGKKKVLLARELDPDNPFLAWEMKEILEKIEKAMEEGEKAGS